MSGSLDILLVDDLDADRLIISRLLADMELSINLHIANDAASALDLLESEQFDCILIDYYLPSSNGEKILEYVRYKNLPSAVVMLTDHLDASIVDDCLIGGAQDFLNKSDLNAQSLSYAISLAIKRFDIEKDIRFGALHDPLTKLANRSLFEEHLEQACLRAQRSGKLVGLVMLDVDDFKKINDRYGHPAGDAALIGVAARLKTVCRRNDTAARIGGDEFVLLLEGLCNIADARRIVENIIEITKHPLRCGDHDLIVGHSIGIAISDGSLEDMTRLVSHADQALYEAKAAGKGCFRIYSANHLNNTRVTETV